MKNEFIIVNVANSEGKGGRAAVRKEHIINFVENVDNKISMALWRPDSNQSEIIDNIIDSFDEIFKKMNF